MCFKFLEKIKHYRNTPLKLPWATNSSPPGPDGQLTHMG
jgi:hypothetical protein